MGDERQNHQKKRRVTLTDAVIVIAIVVMVVSGVNLIRIYQNYSRSNEEYTDLSTEFTVETPMEENAESNTEPVTESVTEEVREDGDSVLIEDAAPPISVDWDRLKEINEDIVGWIYVDALPEISYPVLQGKDNDEYLHTTFRREQLYAGSIFMDYQNSGDWTDPHTIVYGHNMRNGSMFGRLRSLQEEEVFRENPYFWILTPEGNYRYHIFAAFETELDSSVYTLYSDHSEEFLDWETNLQQGSAVPNTLPLSQNDYVVTLSTCTTDQSKRTVVIGKCVSSLQPGT